MTFAEEFMKQREAKIIYKTDREIVGVQNDMTFAIYISPRDYDKVNQNAMIDKGKNGEYKTIGSFFKKYNATQNFVLVVHAQRSGLNYLSGECFYIMIPDETIQKEFEKQASINIGTTSRQQQRWKAEKVVYHPITGDLWDIRESKVTCEDAYKGYQNWCVRLSDSELTMLKEFGFHRDQWFTMETACLEEGEHYIGLGIKNSKANLEFGVWYKVVGKSSQKVVEPTYAIVDGRRIEVNWASLSINLADKEPSQGFLVRTIEMGWFLGFNHLQHEDFINQVDTFKYEEDMDNPLKGLEALANDQHALFLEFPDYPSTSELGPFDWDFDGQQMSSYRKEQNALRKKLLNGKQEAECVICGELYPEDMLWAAHIKKRSKCSPEEKGDISNIAVLMCKTGCDDLFEKGYIAVKDGVIIIVGKPFTRALGMKIEALKGRECLGWKKESEKYFEWHYKYMVEMLKH